MMSRNASAALGRADDLDAIAILDGVGLPGAPGHDSVVDGDRDAAALLYLEITEERFDVEGLGVERSRLSV